MFGSFANIPRQPGGNTSQVGTPNLYQKIEEGAAASQVGEPIPWDCANAKAALFGPRKSVFTAGDVLWLCW